MSSPMTPTSSTSISITSDVPILRKTPYLGSRWSGPRGYGARHIHDKVPFTLWDDTKQDFHLPTEHENAWLWNRYNATEIEFRFPIIFIATLRPPIPLPLTVAGVAAKFVPPRVPDASDNAEAKIRPFGDVRHLAVSTDYAGMRGPKDPLDFSFRKWFNPADDQLNALMEALSQFCNPRFVHILCPRIIVEIDCDGKDYVKGSMPRTIGGFSVHYHHQTEPLFYRPYARTRAVQPNSTQTPPIHDTTNYLPLSCGGLGPGVCVSSASFKDNDGNVLFKNSTAGILLQDNSGAKRLTVSHHCFLDDNRVFHPSPLGPQIGRIDERYESRDIALAELYPSLHFTNDNHFDTERPRRLLRSTEVVSGSWFRVDGMSTGAVFLEAVGISLRVSPWPPGSTAGIEWSKYQIYDGNLGARPVEGLCGGAIIDDGAGTEKGGVAGFFFLGGPTYALSPCLDRLIDQNWRVV